MKKLSRKIRRSLELLSEKGLSGIKDNLSEKRQNQQEAKKYQKWVLEYDQLNQQDKENILAEIKQFSHHPLISILLPVYNIEEKWLRLCLDSVLHQIYPNWELCIADDCSSEPHIKPILEEYAAKDKRIKIVFRNENGHISAASNSALELATGEFCALLDNDDELAEKALFCVAKEINNFPDAALIYSDEDKIDEISQRFSPTFKPDWSPQLVYSLNLINHLGIYRTDILRQTQGFRTGFEGGQDYDLALRFMEKINEKQIRHIPQILYHWRAIKGSVAQNADQKIYAHERARKAIEEYFVRQNEKVKVSQGFAQFHQVKATSENVSISIISAENIPVNQKNTEFIKTDEVSASAFNSAFNKSLGDILIFLNDGITPVSEHWIQALVGQVLRKNIGAVGGKILFPNGKIQQCGIIGGINNSIGFAFNNLPEETQKGLFRSQVIGNFSAVSGVLAIRRELFEQFGGFDSVNLNRGLFEIDLCLRLGENGWRIVFTPYAKFVTKGLSTTEQILQNSNSAEFNFFSTRWKEFMKADKFYNPNLTLEKSDFSMAEFPRLKKF